MRQYVIDGWELNEDGSLGQNVQVTVSAVGNGDRSLRMSRVRKVEAAAPATEAEVVRRGLVGFGSPDSPAKPGICIQDGSIAVVRFEGNRPIVLNLATPETAVEDLTPTLQAACEGVRDE